MAGPPTLLLSAAFALVSAGLYAYVGRVILRREVRGDARLASTLFATFWFALGGVTALGSANSVMGWMGVTEPAAYLTVMHAVFLILWVALWALLYYLGYLFTGSRRLLIPITAFYVAFYVWTLYLIASAGAPRVEVGEWTAAVKFATPPAPGSPASLAFAALLVVPVILGAGLYARLFFKVDGATQRYRIGMVSGTILAWFGSSLVASILQLGSSPWWQIASRFIGVAAGIMIYFAYRPPRWIRERYGIQSIDDERLAS